MRIQERSSNGLRWFVRFTMFAIPGIVAFLVSGEAEAQQLSGALSGFGGGTISGFGGGSVSGLGLGSLSGFGGGTIGGYGAGSLSGAGAPGGLALGDALGAWSLVGTAQQMEQAAWQSMLRAQQEAVQEQSKAHAQASVGNAPLTRPELLSDRREKVRAEREQRRQAWLARQKPVGERYRDNP